MFRTSPGGCVAGETEGVGEGAPAESGDPSQSTGVDRFDVQGGVAVEAVGPRLHQARLGERPCAHGSGSPDHPVPVAEWGERGQGGGPGGAPRVQQGRRLGRRAWSVLEPAPPKTSLLRPATRQRRRPFAHGEVPDLVGDGPTRSRGGPNPFDRREWRQQPVERGLFIGQIGEKERIDVRDRRCGTA